MTSDARRAAKKKAMRQVARVQGILRRWDPLNVAPGEQAPADEYDGYAPHIVSLVVHGCSVEQICKHLQELRSGVFGVAADAQRDGEFAREIVDAVHGEAH